MNVKLPEEIFEHLDSACGCIDEVYRTSEELKRSLDHLHRHGFNPKKAVKRTDPDSIASSWDNIEHHIMIMKEDVEALVKFLEPYWNEQE